MRVAILGCGVMGSAFARQLSLHGHQVILCDRNQEKTEALVKELECTFAREPKEAVAQAEFILLAIKPKDLKGLDLGTLDGHIVMSILVGTTAGELKRAFKGAFVIRSMPNLALRCGESVIALVEDADLSEEVVVKVEHLLKGLGLIFWTQEEKIDAITALAGSGPAFVIAVMEAMIESGIAMGLRADEAKELVLQTLLGAVALLKAEKGHPGAVRWQIAAPGGTTIAGMKAFEEQGVRAGIMHTILATFERTKEIG
ncbi:MAG: Pyrroline-5-carboxylate reductase [Chlamydiae bacterium]|nr:Pyrroline-5-carboxylate reductase [Chlamydiota bacterium]